MMAYIPENQVSTHGNERVQKYVKEYDPNRQFVVLFVCGVRITKKQLREKDPEKMDCITAAVVINKDDHLSMSTEQKKRYAQYKMHTNNKPMEKIHLCSFCKKRLEKLARCSACRVACYCNQECQKRDWPNHKKICHSLKPFENK